MAEGPAASGDTVLAARAARLLRPALRSVLQSRAAQLSDTGGLSAAWNGLAGPTDATSPPAPTTPSTSATTPAPTSCPARREARTGLRSLSPALARQLLADDGPPFAEASAVLLDGVARPTVRGNGSQFGFPGPVYCEDLVQALAAWLGAGHSPIEHDNTHLQLLVGSDTSADVLAALAPVLQPLRAALADAAGDPGARVVTASSPRIAECLEALLGSLGAAQVLALLCQRLSHSSTRQLAPALSVCARSFNARHRAGSVSSLTVGARALSKHCHRDQTTSFWGACTGSEANKNAAANGVLLRVLGDVAWLNVYTLPGSLDVFEVRNSLGYGLRWTADGTEFRGFLEPQMEGGHDKGWRH